MHLRHRKAPRRWWRRRGSGACWTASKRRSGTTRRATSWTGWSGICISTFSASARTRPCAADRAEPVTDGGALPGGALFLAERLEVLQPLAAGDVAASEEALRCDLVASSERALERVAPVRGVVREPAGRLPVAFTGQQGAVLSGRRRGRRERIMNATDSPSHGGRHPVTGSSGLPVGFSWQA